MSENQEQPKPLVSEQTKGKIIYALGMGLYIFVSALAVYEKFSEVNPDVLFGPMVQAVLGILVALGFGPVAGAAARALTGTGNGAKTPKP